MDREDIAAEMGLQICWMPFGGTCDINADCNKCESAIEYEKELREFYEGEMDWV